MRSWAKTGLNPIQEYPLVLEWCMFQSTGNQKDIRPAFTRGGGGGGVGVVVTDK